VEPFHKRLRKTRLSKALTMKALAEKIGVSRSTYRDWEYGAKIQGQPYLKMSQALGVTVYELLSGEPPESNELRAIADQLNEISNKIRMHVLPFFDGEGPPSG
jgi:transcriptional regulator with XRE-family HTH domain